MDKKQLIAILTELSNSRKAITNERQLKDLMDQYDIIFLGEHFDCIDTPQLRHTIDKVFHIQISLKDLNALLSSVCPDIDMEIVPIVLTGNLSEPIIDGYRIHL